MRGDKQPTIVDIAVRLSVSISTVSRALHNAPDVNPDTKKAVLDMARKLGYEPNTVAASLRTNKTRIIGVVVPEFIQAYFPNVILGVQSVARNAGYKVMICQSSESLSIEIENMQAMLSSRVDGLIMALSRETNRYDHIRRLQAKNIPIVFFNRVTEELVGSKVLVDDYNGAFKAVEHLISIGCKRIAHLAGPEKLTITENRLSGYMDALKKHGLPIESAYIKHSDFVEGKAKTATRQLLKMKKRPDAIFAVNDPTAIEALICIKENKLQVPADIALAGFSNAPHSSFVDPPLTSVVQPTFEIGQVAANLLLKQIEMGDAYQPEIKLLDAQLVIRESTMR